MATWKQIISDISEKGYSLNEIAVHVGGYAELLSEVLRGFKYKNGEPKRPPEKWHCKLRKLHADTRHLEPDEHRYGKPRDWQKIIKALNRRGFSFQHIGDIIDCNSTHIRDVKSSLKNLHPMLRVQGKLLQLYDETTDWPDKKILKGNNRTHGNLSMIKTIGQGWQV